MVSIALAGSRVSGGRADVTHEVVVLWQPDPPPLNLLLMLARVARRAVLARALSVDASRGRELAGQGRLREAADAFRTAARATPARADDHASLGEVLLQLGELDEAEGALRAAVSADASHSLAHCNLGQLLGPVSYTHLTLPTKRIV